MAKRVVSVLLVLMVFWIILGGGLFCMVANAPMSMLSPDLQELRRLMNGPDIVNMALQEHTTFHSLGLQGGMRYWDMAKDAGGNSRINYNAPWCVCFVLCCAWQCGLIGDGYAWGDFGGGDWRFNCGELISYMVTNGYAECYDEPGSYRPVPGDLIFFDSTGPNSVTPDHVGIVAAVYADGSLELYDGNSGHSEVLGGRVGHYYCSDYNIGSLAYSEGYVSAYLHPNYPESTYISVEQEIYYYLTKELQIPMAAACGILANIEHESAFDVNAVGDSNTSYGLCQWHKSRYNQLVTHCAELGYNYNTVLGQMEYLRYELEYVYPELLGALRSVENTAAGAYEAGYLWCVEFERPSNMEVKADIRGTLALEEYWPKYSGDAIS